jgi:tetratricopeptide (TPR) repeat protein
VDRDKELHIKTHKNTREAIAIFQDYDLVAEPGTQYFYSSYGYNLLGAAIEGASGQSYGNFIRQHIFSPLNMSDSRMDDPEAAIPNRVKGYRLLDGKIAPSKFVDMSSRFAAGGTRSTIADLLKYARGILQAKLLSPPSWKAMLIPMSTSRGMLTGRGMSWSVRPRKGHFQITHGGSQAETKTYLLIFPLENFAVAIASNLESFERELYAYKLAELVLEEDLDTPVYLADGREEAFYAACDEVFSYGLSHYLWHSRTLARNEKDLEKAFDFFNDSTDPATLRRDLQATLEDLAAGIHPVQGQAFTKVGSFMAAQLDKALGRKNLRDYHQKGPTAFFTDYERIAQNSVALKKSLRFKRGFRQMIARWDRDRIELEGHLNRPYSIPLDAEASALRNTLKPVFSTLSLYPDFHSDLIRVAQVHLKAERNAQAHSILRLAHDLYPNRIRPMTALASVHLWSKNPQEAKLFFHKAHKKNPLHPELRIDRFQVLARDLIQAGKTSELEDLAAIVVELYPRSPGVLEGLGDMFHSLGQEETALLYYKKAFRMNKKRDDVRKKIKSIEKTRKK